MTKSCFLCSKKLGFMDDTFGKYTLSKMGKSIPKGFGNEDVICYDCLQSQQKLEQTKREESKPKKDSKPTSKGGPIPSDDSFVFKDKQSNTQTLPGSPSNMVWLLPILLGVIGGVLMYFILKDEDKERAQHGLNVGIIVNVICVIIAIIIFLNVGI